MMMMEVLRLSHPQNWTLKHLTLTSVRIRSTDAGGNFLETPFAITITNVNELPLGVSLDNDSVMEGWTSAR